MDKILFVMFQGSATNLKTWNEYTESKFLDKLKKLGEVYVYQDKTYNIWFYDNTNPERKDFESDIDIDLDYVKVDTHIKMIYNELQKKYKNYKYIPIGWSAGAFLALYFAQKYKKECKFTVLLDSALWTPTNIKLRLKTMKKDIDNVFPITNKKYLELLKQWKNEHSDIEKAYQLNSLTNYVRTMFISKRLSIELPIKTIAFVNIQKPEKDEWSKDFNNKTRLEEIKILKEKNPDNFTAYIFENKTHYIFNKKQPANKIISVIKNALF